MEPMMLSSVFMTDKCAQELGTHLVCGCAVYYYLVYPNPDSILSHCPSEYSMYNCMCENAVCLIH